MSTGFPQENPLISPMSMDPAICKIGRICTENTKSTPLCAEPSMTSATLGKRKSFDNFSHKATILSTDMRCYFGCNEGFKKDYDLRLHLKLRHRNEDETEMRAAYQDAEDEIALTKRSMSIFQCVLCPTQHSGSGRFYEHIKQAHNMKWQHYKSQYGPCEVERGAFQCKICSRVVKYDNNTVHSHLKRVHNISWAMYLDRIRKLRRGERLDDLPIIEYVTCKICNATIKHLSHHIGVVHKITVKEYADLFKGEYTNVYGAQPTSNVQEGSSDGKMKIKPEIQGTFQSNSIIENYEKIVPTPNLSGKAECMTPPYESDIKDKNNRICSTCDTRFETRRLFIEHCSLIHNMKFKTASGVTICMPTLNQQPDSKAHVPRNIAEDNFPTPKRFKIMPHTSLSSYPNSKVNNGSKTVRFKGEIHEAESINIGTETRYGRKINQRHRV